MENQFDLGLNIASIETELPDPVITLTGADRLTASDTAEMPLLALTAYGRSWQDNSTALISVGDSGNINIASHGKNLCSSQELEPGTFSANGELYETSTAVRTAERIYLGEGTYTVSVKGAVRCVGYKYSSTDALTGTRIFDWGSSNMPQTFTLSEAAYCAFAFNKGSGIDVTTEEIYGLMVESRDSASAVEAEITTGLPLRGIPVSSGGNYTDSNGQEWICDTIEHVYGEPAQAVKRIKKATVNGAADSHGKAVDSQGYSCVCISYALSSTNALLWYGDYGVYYPYSDGVGGEFRIFADTKQGLIELRDLTTWEVTQTETFTGNKMVGNEITAERFELFGNWQNADERKQPLFTLDSGDPVPEIYISTTGQLNDGAEIIYPSEPQAVMLTTEETEAMNRLSGYEGSTTVYNENTAEMTVKLLREDFEMQYIHWIKESQSFICEKSGKYKIICVGGGSSGGIGAAGAADVLQAVGTTTSFGSIISANGGGRSKTSASEHFEHTGTVGGQSGYDGINYGSSAHVLSSTGSAALSSSGGESTVMWGTGHGYGAGGGAKGMLVGYTAGTSTNIDFVACGGQCGKIESTIVDLEENQTVFCTVGGGGALNLSDDNVMEYVVNYVDSTATAVKATGTELSACVTNGADGVIIVQYLGL